MRKLASIQKILSIRPIENADAIEVARVEGWDVVVKKDEFKVGEDVVYCEIDSFLPIEPQYEFLRSSSFKNSPILGEGFLLKTIRLRGQYSQGLILPISVVEEKGWHGLPVGTDVTELLGIRKWEVPEMATTGGTTAGKLPPCIHKTDETRIQNVPELIEEFGNREYYITTKLDGSSHSIAVDSEDIFHVTGHNYEYKNDGKCSFYNYIIKVNAEEAVRKYMAEKGYHAMTVQGEYCGPGIQKNKLKLKQPDWYFFTIDVDGKRVGLDVMEDFANFAKENKYDIKMVPLQERDFCLKDKYPDADALLERCAKDVTGIYKGGQPEGIVVRPVVPVYSQTLGAELSLKAVNNKYLLKNS